MGPRRLEASSRTARWRCSENRASPKPQINVHVAGIEIDFLFSFARLIVEVDGARYHDTPFARRNDAYKQARLEAAGYQVIRLTWDQVTRRPEQTAARINRALATSPSVR